MKKLIIILFVVLAIIGLAVGGIFLYNKLTSVAIEDVLPENPVFLLQASSMSDNLSAFASTEIWQSIAGINYPLLLKSSNVTDEKIEELTQAVKILFSQEAALFFEKIFGHKFALAIYMDAASPSPSFENVFAGIFLVTRIGSDVQVLELLTQSMNQISPDVEKTSEDYKNHSVQTFIFKNNPIRLSYVRIRDLLIIGVPSAVHRSIDIFTKEEFPLAQDSQYQNIRQSFLAKPDLAGYWNMERTFGLLKEQAIMWIKSQANLGQDMSASLQSVDEFFAQMKGFTAAVFSMKRAEILKLKFDLFYKPEELKPDIAKFYSTCQPQVNKTLEFIPNNILGYHWSACLDLENYWQQVKKEMAKAPNIDVENAGQSIDDKIKAMEAEWDLSVEGDIIPAFGNEIGGYLSDIQSGGFFPIPYLLLLVEVANQTKVEKMIDKLKELPYLQFQTEDVAGTTIHYALSPMPSIEPAYCFFNNFLLVAINRDIIKKSLATVGDQNNSLLKQDVFSPTDFDLNSEHTSVQWIRFGTIFEKVSGLIELGNSLMAAQDARQDAFQAGSERRLADKRNELVTKEQELAGQKERLTVLDGEITNLTAQSMDATTQQEQLAQLKEQIVFSENEIVNIKNQITELENVSAGFKKRSIGPALRKLYIDEAIKPVLKGLQSIDAFGAQTDFKEGLIETKMFLKIR